MIKQNLIIYSNPILYEILKELENEIEYNIEEISTDRQFDNKEFSQYLVLTNKKTNKFLNTIQLDFPVKISKLIEKVPWLESQHFDENISHPASVVEVCQEKTILLNRKSVRKLSHFNCC